MKIESKLILASKSAVTGVNLYTFVLTYPRVILAEVNTHRMLSRNTASSRAIPSKKQRERVLQDPFLPVTIGQNQKGMQAGAELSGWRRTAAYKTWEYTRYVNVFASYLLDKLGAHKQVVNRIVEPWTYTQQVVTATDLKNVFKLRNHKDAEPHFQIIAKQMQEQVEYVELLFEKALPPEMWKDDKLYRRRLELYGMPKGIGVIQVLRPGEWHLPFVDDDELWPGHNYDLAINWEELKQVSTARDARVSYFLPENGQRSDYSRDLELCGRLSTSGHMSPFEHIATPLETATYMGNFKGWKQYRKEFEQEAGGDR